MSVQLMDNCKKESREMNLPKLEMRRMRKLNQHVGELRGVVGQETTSF